MKWSDVDDYFKKRDLELLEERISLVEELRIESILNGGIKIMPPKKKRKKPELNYIGQTVASWQKYHLAKIEGKKYCRETEVGLKCLLCRLPGCRADDDPDRRAAWDEVCWLGKLG